MGPCLVHIWSKVQEDIDFLIPANRVKDISTFSIDWLPCESHGFNYRTAAVENLILIINSLAEISAALECRLTGRKARVGRMFERGVGAGAD